MGVPGPFIFTNGPDRAVRDESKTLHSQTSKRCGHDFVVGGFAVAGAGAVVGGVEDSVAHVVSAVFRAELPGDAEASRRSAGINASRSELRREAQRTTRA